MRVTALRSIVCTALCLIGAQAYGASLEEHAPNPGAIQVVPLEPSPDPDHVNTHIIYPKNQEVRTSAPIKGQIHLEGYALGVDTELPRKKEVWNDPEGQSIHIFIDNQPYFAINEALINALDDVENYFDQTADFTIPFKLDPGMHVIRAFPVRSYNECVRSRGAFTASTFYYKVKKEDPKINLSAPYLTYNEPQGEYDYDKKNQQPILLDFYITNCEMSKDGYKVRLTLDGDIQRTLTTWQPYSICGLQKGMHSVRLELLDPSNEPVSGSFNDVTRTFVIK